MNAHNPIDRSALILGALNLTDSQRDPIAELRERTRREHQNLLVNIDLLLEALPHYRKTAARVAITGIDNPDNNYAQLQVLIAMNDIFYTDTMEEAVRSLSRDLGIDEDATDDSFHEQVRADYYERKL
jgi:hypothetical protein